jgi:Sulfotransferase domain
MAFDTHKLHRVGVRARDLYRVTTCFARALPDFVIIGGQKCGTSALYYYLVEHPDVVPARRKETHFFDTRKHELGRMLYRASFPIRANLRRDVAAEERLITGESTPGYLFFPHVPARVRTVVPDAKLVVLLRNPVDRAYSHYQHKVRIRKEAISFAEAVDREEERLAGEMERVLADPRYYSYNLDQYSYLRRGIYVEQLKAWRRFFPEEQLLILRSEDLYEDAPAVVGRTLEFLGLPTASMDGYPRHNVGDYAEQMDAGLRERLVEYFEPHNLRLYEYLGRDFGWDR